MWILIIGNPVDGFSYHGPYTSNEDVVEAGEQSSEADWWIATLHSPATQEQPSQPPIST